MKNRSPISVPRRNPTGTPAGSTSSFCRGQRQQGEFFFYPRALSPGEDMSEDIEWVKASGKAKVWTYAIHHMGPTKAYKNDPPYVVALVETSEGVKMMTNIVDCAPKDVFIGMDVEVVFDDVTDQVTLPKFKPAK